MIYRFSFRCKLVIACVDNNIEKIVDKRKSSNRNDKYNI